MALTWSQGRRWIVRMLVLGVAVLLVWDLAGWARGHLNNRAVEAVLAASAIDLEEDMKPAEQFAFAWAAQQRGERDRASAAYQLVVASAATPEQLRISAHYNLANLYLNRAIGFAMEPDVDRAHTETELSKIHYRAALRMRPDHWDARYNLETAHMLVPYLPEGDLSSIPEEDDTPDDTWADFLQGRPQGLP